MKHEVILSGFGGQGVMSIGKNLVEAGVAEDLHASWVPSYGPEMRGGTANCTVILSDERIGSPIVEKPSEIIVMNRAALAKFGSHVQPGGTIFINSSIVPDKVERTDVNVYYVPCDDIARELGNTKVSNMVMLGAYVAATKILKIETIENMIHEMFSGKKAKLIPMNMEALKRGIACAEG
ncbi:MAG: 2-oxoacid:acceptor oxidoreductase family protein [Megasphaera sp.]|jgi:2-oxoglutarate ferredoxin oxidoreductase subunit gamma|nr:2-oxoacid:acceptor oxidoreductase family protein [Megasphaera sp.]MCH4187362.1 2-oxoacid:acceptor oxidoreductase family protein [Megasphaera sp.]MCH4217544.1 2-oxoacid:acceptor oxidoreductase family protein [Megasphaera sp.]